MHLKGNNVSQNNTDRLWEYYHYSCLGNKWAKAVLYSFDLNDSIF